MHTPLTSIPLGQVNQLLPAAESHIAILHSPTGMEPAQMARLELLSKCCAQQQSLAPISRSPVSTSGLMQEVMSCTSATMLMEVVLVLRLAQHILLILRLELLLLFLLRKFSFALLNHLDKTNLFYSSYAYTTMPGEITAGLGITKSIAIPTHPASYFPGIAPYSALLG